MSKLRSGTPLALGHVAHFFPSTSFLQVAILVPLALLLHEAAISTAADTTATAAAVAASSTAAQTITRG